MTTPTKDPVRGELVDAAIRLLATDGAEAMVLRRVASAAHVSTMCVYSRFGDKHGLMNAVYLGGFERLSRAMSDASVDPDPLRRLIDLAMALRGFALANPALYTLMFERMVGFDPAPELRAETVQQSFDSFEAAMAEAVEGDSIVMGSPVMAAYTFWTAAHGAVSMEMTRAAPGPLQDLLADTGEEVYKGVLQTTLRGMSTTSAGSGAVSPDIVGT